MTKAAVKRKNSNFWERNRKSDGYLLKKVTLNFAAKVCRFVLLFGMCFMILQPILNKISVSFMEEQDLYNPVVVAIPEHFTTENYAIAAEIMDYSHSVVNSLVVSLTIAILQITVCTLVGYGFARFNFPFKKFWFACVLMVVLVPPQTISTSLYLHFRFFDILGIFKAITGNTINLRGSVLPYYLMSAGCMGLKNGLYVTCTSPQIVMIVNELLAEVTKVTLNVTVSSGSSGFYIFVECPDGTYAERYVSRSGQITITDLNGHLAYGKWKISIMSVGQVSTATARMRVDYSY